MMISWKVIIYFMTAGVSMLCVSGNKRGPVNIACDNTPVSQTAHLGGSVTINCRYSRAEESYVRCLCREDENFHCKSLISAYTSDCTKKDRFSLIDNKQQGVYTVTISTLTLADAGRYQCAMERFNNSSTACLTRIDLQILNWDDIKPTTTKTSDSGDTVRISCSYPDIHENNQKFLCKGENPFNCEELIHTTVNDRDVVKGRFDIRDNRRMKYFYLSIKNVSTADSGTYWCGSDRTWQQDKYIKVLLSVAEGHFISGKSGFPDPEAEPESAPGSKSSTRYESPNPPNIGMIAGVVVFSVLFLILVIVLILYRHKLPRTKEYSAARGSSEDNTGHSNEGDIREHHYDDIQMQNQQAGLGEALPSVYATVNLPVDQLHYASVRFQKDTTDGNTLPVTSVCDSSSISWPQGATHPPAEEQILYSTLTYPEEP
ncbi:CMRF35-like molecule 8 isoform X2 [Micropterus salmoides]|uniref:CMRF35-like molecule 8 isoform X2 n=1 Tax=Micropterus salmoides TaxID=27706 RepID=UPI0018EE30D0|nr:CMRF35-like molecule 8 isoform X2 [Micropterus salmoides]